MIPQTKGRGQGCGHRVLPPGRYPVKTKKRRSIRPTKTLFRTPRASGGNKKKQKYPRAFPTENPQIGKRGQGDSVGKIEKPQRKKPERLQNKIRAEKPVRRRPQPPPYFNRRECRRKNPHRDRAQIGADTSDRAKIQIPASETNRPPKCPKNGNVPVRSHVYSGANRIPGRSVPPLIPARSRTANGVWG